MSAFDFRKQRGEIIKKDSVSLNLNMWRSCCSSESPGKSACFVTSSATIQMK